MTEGVVDRFEVVKVEAQHRYGGDVAVLPGDGLFQAIEEVRPVGQARQTVAERFAGDLGQQALVLHQHDELTREHRATRIPSAMSSGPCAIKPSARPNPTAAATTSGR